GRQFQTRTYLSPVNYCDMSTLENHRLIFRLLKYYLPFLVKQVVLNDLASCAWMESKQYYALFPEVYSSLLQTSKALPINYDLLLIFQVQYQSDMDHPTYVDPLFFQSKQKL